MQPHRIRYWLHSSEKEEDPESFSQKVTEICGIYQNAQESSQKDQHIISTDEMTDILVLEHKYPDKLPLLGQCAKMESEYIRHRTTSPNGFFDVASGRMEDPYLNLTRTEKDFVKAVGALISADPRASGTFVCDGLNMHKAKSLVRFVSETSSIDTELGEKEGAVF